MQAYSCFYYHDHATHCLLVSSRAWQVYAYYNYISGNLRIYSPESMLTVIHSYIFQSFTQYALQLSYSTKYQNNFVTAITLHSLIMPYCNVLCLKFFCTSQCNLSVLRSLISVICFIIRLYCDQNYSYAMSTLLALT